MIDTLKAVALPIVLLFVFPFLILWLRDRISQALWIRRNPPEKLLADRLAFEDRLLHPDWGFYERHLQRTVPLAVYALYADRSLITAQGIDIVDGGGFEITICTFEPLDEQGLLETRFWLSFDGVAIASSDSGDPIYLRPGASEPNTVYLTFHDGGDTEVLINSIDAFVQMLKTAMNAPARLE